MKIFGIFFLENEQAIPMLTFMDGEPVRPALFDCRDKAEEAVKHVLSFMEKHGINRTKKNYKIIPCPVDCCETHVSAER